MKYYNEKTKEASYRYKERHIKRIPLDVQNDMYDEIKGAAEAVGESVNGYIKGAIIERLNRDKTHPNKP